MDNPLSTPGAFITRSSKDKLLQAVVGYPLRSKVLMLLQREPMLTTAELSTQFNIGNASMYKHMRRLWENGVVIVQNGTATEENPRSFGQRWHIHQAHLREAVDLWDEMWAAIPTTDHVYIKPAAQRPISPCADARGGWTGGSGVHSWMGVTHPSHYYADGKYLCLGHVNQNSGCMWCMVPAMWCGFPEHHDQAHGHGGRKNDRLRCQVCQIQRGERPTWMVQTVEQRRMKRTKAVVRAFLRSSELEG